jgi:acetoin utilization protein AcuB
MIIKDILLPGLATISLHATMLEAKKLMNQKGFRHLPVSDGVKLVGMISDRDVKLAEVADTIGNGEEGHLNAYKLVSDYMSSPVLKARITDRLESVIREMLNVKVSSVVIEDLDGKDFGIITTEDLLIVFLDMLDKDHPLLEKLKLGFMRSSAS